jgi:hypothetical protein
VLAEDYDPDAARHGGVELAGWLSARTERDAALRQLTEAVGAMVFRTGAQAMLDVLLAALPDGEGERLLCGLRGDPVLAPLALNTLAHRGLLSPESMTDAEHLLLLAENLLQLVELAGGGDGAEEALRAQGPEARDAVAAALDSAHPDRAGLEALRQTAARALRTPAPASPVPGRVGAPSARVAASGTADQAGRDRPVRRRRVRPTPTNRAAGNGWARRRTSPVARVTVGAVAEGWDEEWLRVVRGALHVQDWVALLAALQRGTVREVLQLAGDGVAGAAARGLPGAAEMAASFIGELRERGFRGDEELAHHLAAAIGDGAIPLLRPLAVDLEMLAMLLEGDLAESGGRIELSTGECWPAFTDELEPGAEVEEADDRERWLYVPALGSRAGYRDMELFIEGLGDVALADRLRVAITGRGAFRRFRDVLARDERAWRRYHRLSDERQRGRARAWLVEEGYCPSASCGASSR